MSDVILKIENVSKQYQLGTFGTRTIGGDVHRWWTTQVLGKEDPFLKVGEVNERTSKEKVDFVWALKDINFEVKRGEVLGIIGKNGAGKSTLLKLLSRVTSPTTGTIKSAGRMASLLEVGTGFHPELTGLENIYLNGAILGMTKSEIIRKLDEIIDFSGCALYIDTPVKRYSSGMKVRLGFAVAAFLDPEILVVDEVLAVGDAEFQNKAIGKMKEVSQDFGRTVLFVSHNLHSINQLCDTGLLIENGQIKTYGNIEDVTKQYLQNHKKADKLFYFDNSERLYGIKDMNLSRAMEISFVRNTSNKYVFQSVECLGVGVGVHYCLDSISTVRFVGTIYNIVNEQPVFTFTTNEVNVEKVKRKVFNFEINLRLLVPGEYIVNIAIGKGTEQTGVFENYDVVKGVLCFSVINSDIKNWGTSWSRIHQRVELT